MRGALDSMVRRLASQRGFTMVPVMMSMLGIMSLSAVAIATTSNGSAQSNPGQQRGEEGADVASRDQEGASYNRESKDAYSAAEAGIADYQYHLNNDNTYWAKCTGVPAPNAVNQRWNGTTPTNDPRTWRNVPGSASSAQYTIELLPANGQPVCAPADPAGTMIDATSGTFRIRATGRVRTGVGNNYAKRTIVTTFKRRGFLDYLYFTDLETSDPAWYELNSRGRQTFPNGQSGPDVVTWASNECSKYWRDGRGNEQYIDGDNDGSADDGRINWFDGQNYPFSANCTNIQFAGGDRIRGPLHTNDELLVCGSPEFGRNAQDKIEVSSQAPGWRASGSCSGTSPTFTGTFTPNSPILAMPPSNSKLKKVVEASAKFTGKTTIVLGGGAYTVTNPSMGLSNVSRPMPTNGVIYVEDAGCGMSYRPLNLPSGDVYNTPDACGDVYVSGSYSKDITIAAEKDVIIRDDITRNGNFVAGLIANNFVRVYKPGTNFDYDCTSCSAPTCTNGPGVMTNVTIDAAILALQHSFTVDNYFCGAALGTLTVNGVIAQKYRGPVGRGGDQIVNGYLKDYNYDDRLSLRQPPHFLDPVQSAWRIQRQTEQTPSR